MLHNTSLSFLSPPPHHHHGPYHDHHHDPPNTSHHDSHRDPHQVMKRIDSDASAHHTVPSPKMDALRSLPGDEDGDGQGEGAGAKEGFETVTESGGAFKLGILPGATPGGKLTAARGSLKKPSSLSQLGRTNSMSSMAEDDEVCDTTVPTELDRDKLSAPPVVKKRPTLFTMASLRSLSGRDLRSSWGKHQVNSVFKILSFQAHLYRLHTLSTPLPFATNLVLTRAPP